MQNLFFKKIESPVGDLYSVADGTHLTHLYFAKAWPAFLSENKKNGIQLLPAGKKIEVLNQTEAELKLYFKGQLKRFSIPLKFSGTEFQKQSWMQLTKIPFGVPVSYSDQAKAMGKPKAVRAVGSANGKNPICIIVPCHRVIAKDGSLGGYSSGLSNKKKLLAIEGISLGTH